MEKVKAKTNSILDGNIENMFVLMCDEDTNPLRLFKLTRREYASISKLFYGKDDKVRVYTGYEEKDLEKLLEEKGVLDRVVTNSGKYKDLKELFTIER